MGQIFYAAPSTTSTPAPPNPWPGVDMTWTDTRGVVWSLIDTRSGVFLQPGVRGLTLPPRDRFTSSSAGVAGVRNRGGRTKERGVFWPIYLYQDDSSQAWLDYDRDWWAGLNPRGTGVWRVTQPNGQWRELVCRPTGDEDHAWDRAPGLRSWQRYGVSMVAEDPFWYGPTVASPLWRSATPVDFIPAGGGPPYHPGSATTIDSATLTNPGDEDAWPLWTVTGPVDSVDVAVDGRSVGFGELLEGQVLTIDTDPRVQRAMLDGADVTGQLTAHDFAPIRPGETAHLDVSMVGGGTLQASFRPRYDRAW